MSGPEITLDHAGLVGLDAGALHAAWEALGFALTPLSRQGGRLSADGPVEPWGTANRRAVLPEGGYVELLAITDPALPANGLDALLRRHAGMHVLGLGMADEEAELARLRRAGLAVALLEQPADGDDTDEPPARFARLLDAPEGRVQLVRHLTPELPRRERFTAHPNRAVALEAVVIAAAAPAETAVRLSLLSGRPVRPDPAGGFALPLDRGTVRVLTPEALEAVLPGTAVPCLPFMAAMVIRTADGTGAVRGLRPELEPTPLGLAARAGGATVAFV